MASRLLSGNRCYLEQRHAPAVDDALRHWLHVIEKSYRALQQPVLIPINRGDRRARDRQAYSQADEHVAQDAEKEGMVVRQAGLVGGQFDRDCRHRAITAERLAREIDQERGADCTCCCRNR